MSQKVSKGFITREFPGHFTILILLSLKHCIEIFPVWHGVPSCWKMTSLPGNHSLTYCSLLYH